MEMLTTTESGVKLKFWDKLNMSIFYSKKNCRFFVLIIFLLIFSGCKRNKINLNNVKNKIYHHAKYIQIKNLIYKLGLTGVECKICAKKVIKKLEQINGIAKVEFISLDRNFKNYYVLIYLKNKKSNINIDQINTELLKEEFKLKFIEGEFIGHFILKENNLFFQLCNSENFYKVKTLKSEKIKQKKMISINGKFEFGDKVDDIMFVV